VIVTWRSLVDTDVSEEFQSSIFVVKERGVSQVFGNGFGAPFFRA
jgi:hypothetical protein